LLGAAALLASCLTSCFGTAGKGSGGPEPPAGKTIFIDQKNNTGIADGSEAHPFLNVFDALTISAPGDTIQIKPGTYTVALSISQRLTFRGESASTTILQGNGKAPLFIGLSGTGGPLTIEKLTLTNGFDTKGAAVRAVKHAVRLRECIITANDTGNVGGDFEIFNAGALFLSDADSLVERCLIVDNLTSALGSNGKATITLRNVLIVSTPESAILINGDKATPNPDLVLENVTIHGSKQAAISLDFFTDAVFTNVIVSESEFRSVREGDTSGDPLLFYNDLEDGYTDADTDSSINDPALINALDPPAVNVGNLVADPGFVDENGGDFHLAASSPCLDAGSPRILDADGTRSDMGVFGGPGGDFDETFASAFDHERQPLSGGFVAVPVIDPRFDHWLAAEPRPGTPASPHRVDLNADGSEDEVHITPSGGLRAVLCDQDDLCWPGLMPRSPLPALRVGSFDVDGDGRLDLLVARSEGVEAYLQRNHLPRTIRVGAEAGDLVEVDLSGSGRFSGRTLRRTVDRRGDDGSGRLVIGIGARENLAVRVQRNGRTVLEWTGVCSGDVLDLPQRDG